MQQAAKDWQEYIDNFPQRQWNAAMHQKELKGSILPIITLNPNEISSAKKQGAAPETIDELIAHQTNLENLARNKKPIPKEDIETQTKIVEDIISDIKPSYKRITGTRIGEKGETKTGTETQNQGETESEEQTETETQTKQQTSTKTNTQTQTQSQAGTQLKPKTKQKTKTKIPTTSITTSKIPAKSKIPEAEPAKVPIRIRFEIGAKSDRETRRLIRESGGAIAWRQGELHGKDRWDVIVSPYTKHENYKIVLGRQPVGARIVRGPGSARKTAQLLYGRNIQRETVFDQPGIFSTRLKPISKNSLSLEFERDSNISSRPEPVSKNRKVFPLAKA